MENQQQTQQTHGKNWYDRNYKLMLAVPAVVLILSIVYLSMFVSKTGDIINKDVSLMGGTTVSVFDKSIDVSQIEKELKTQISDIQIRKISDMSTGGQRGFSLETTKNYTEIKPLLEKLLGYPLTQDVASVESSGATLSAGFYNQLIGAIEAAFLLMAWVVFLVFAESKKIKAAFTMLAFTGTLLVLPSIGAIKFIAGAGIIAGFIIGTIGKNSTKTERRLFWISAAASIILFFLPIKLVIIPIAIVLAILAIAYSIPSFAVVSCAFADIIMTVAVIDISGMRLSLAGIIAFLMLIGYSVDTDILLTTRVLKRRDEHAVNQEIWGAFKTGITMTLTAAAAFGVSLIVISNFSETLRQIFTILLVGLGFDIFNTWVTNASIVKWYVEAKRRHNE